MFKRILVCGAGAIGGTIAAFLKRAGHSVSIVDIVPEHLAAIQANGLAIIGPIAEFTAALDAYAPHELRGEFDLILLAVKAQHTRSAVEVLKPHLAANGTLVSVQNGLNEYLVASMIGAERTLGCFVHFGAEYRGPGKIAYLTHAPFMLGEIDGRMTERLRAVHAVIRDFEPDAEMTDNVFGFLWSKLVFSAMMIAQALVKVPTQEFLDDPQFRPMIHHMVGDVAKVAKAERVRLMPFQGFDSASFLTGDQAAMDASITSYANARRGSKRIWMGVYRDLFIRNRTTEVEAWYRPVLDLAEKHKIAVPVLKMGIDVIGTIEAGRRSLTDDLAAEVNALIREISAATRS